MMAGLVIHGDVALGCQSRYMEKPAQSNTYTYVTRVSSIHIAGGGSLSSSYIDIKYPAKFSTSEYPGSCDATIDLSGGILKVDKGGTLLLAGLEQLTSGWGHLLGTASTGDILLPVRFRIDASIENSSRANVTKLEASIRESLRSIDGSIIVIASTAFSSKQAEERVVRQISLVNILLTTENYTNKSYIDVDVQVLLDTPLKFRHVCVKHTVDGTNHDDNTARQATIMCAEVALLTRNIKILNGNVNLSVEQFGSNDIKLQHVQFERISSHIRAQTSLRLELPNDYKAKNMSAIFTVQKCSFIRSRISVSLYHDISIQSDSERHIIQLSNNVFYRAENFAIALIEEDAEIKTNISDITQSSPHVNLVVVERNLAISTIYVAIVSGGSEKDSCWTSAASFCIDQAISIFSYRIEMRITGNVAAGTSTDVAGLAIYHQSMANTNASIISISCFLAHSAFVGIHIHGAAESAASLSVDISKVTVYKIRSVGINMQDMPHSSEISIQNATIIDTIRGIKIVMKATSTDLYNTFSRRSISTHKNEYTVRIKNSLFVASSQYNCEIKYYDDKIDTDGIALYEESLVDIDTDLNEGKTLFNLPLPLAIAAFHLVVINLTNTNMSDHKSQQYSSPYNYSPYYVEMASVTFDGYTQNVTHCANASHYAAAAILATTAVESALNSVLWPIHMFRDISYKGCHRNPGNNNKGCFEIYYNINRSPSSITSHCQGLHRPLIIDSDGSLVSLTNLESNRYQGSELGSGSAIIPSLHRAFEEENIDNCYAALATFVKDAKTILPEEYLMRNFPPYDIDSAYCHLMRPTLNAYICPHKSIAAGLRSYFQLDLTIENSIDRYDHALSLYKGGAMDLLGPVAANDLFARYAGISHSKFHPQEPI